MSKNPPAQSTTDPAIEATLNALRELAFEWRRNRLCSSDMKAGFEYCSERLEEAIEPLRRAAHQLRTERDAAQHTIEMAKRLFEPEPDPRTNTHLIHYIQQAREALDLEEGQALLPALRDRLRRQEHLTLLRETLGADADENVLQAARRLVAERDRLHSERDKARKAAAQQAEFLKETCDERDRLEGALLEERDKAAPQPLCPELVPQRCKNCGGSGHTNDGFSFDCEACGGQGWTLKPKAAPEALSYRPTDLCPRCGIGRDTDGDGDCAACAGKPAPLAPDTIPALHIEIERLKKEIKRLDGALEEKCFQYNHCVQQAEYFRRENARLESETARLEHAKLDAEQERDALRKAANELAVEQTAALHLPKFQHLSLTPAIAQLRALEDAAWPGAEWRPALDQLRRWLQELIERRQDLKRLRDDRDNCIEDRDEARKALFHAAEQLRKLTAATWQKA